MQRSTRKSRRDIETEALNAFFTSDFTAKISLQAPWSPERSRKSKARKTDSCWRKIRSDQGTFKQIGYRQGSDGMDPQELRVNLFVARSFLFFFLKAHGNGVLSLRTGRMCHPYLQKGKTEDLGNHRQLSLSLIRELNVKRNF